MARTEVGEAEWDRYVNAHADAAVYHLAAFRRFIEDVTGHRAHYMTARRHGRLAGILPLIELRSRLFGHYFVSLPYFNYCGILADDDEARHALADSAERAARDASADHVELRHLGPVNGVSWRVKTAKDELFLDLPDTAAALMTGLRPKVRGRIRRPQKEGVTARVGGVELLDGFYTVFARNMRDLGTPVYGRSFFAHLFESFSDRLS